MINPLERPSRQNLQFAKGDMVIVCEGFDDCAVVAHLTKSWNRKPKIGTKSDPPGSSVTWEQEFALLGVAIEKDEIGGVACVFDAERSPAKQLKQMRDWLDGIGMPDAKHGEIKSARRGARSIYYGCFVNPSDQKKGAIDTLFLPQVTSAPESECIQSLIACYRKSKVRIANFEKVMVRTYLALKKPHNTGLNISLNDGILNCEGAEFDGLRQFLNLCRNRCFAP